MVPKLESRIEKRFGNLPPQIENISEARCTSGLFLHGGLERPLSEAVKVYQGLPWKPQKVGNVRVMEGK